MLERENRLDVQGLADYLVSIIREFVEEQEKVVMTYDEFPRKVIFHLNVAANDLPSMEGVQFTYRAFNHIVNKATQANLGIAGSLDDQFGTTL
jgi:hypothetical protein